jgi:hypothetical protein
MADKELAEVFGIELAAAAPVPVQLDGPTSAPVVEPNRVDVATSIQEPKVQPRRKARRRISSAARAKLAAAARARWKKLKEQGKRDNYTARPKMSAATKARIIAKIKARWTRAKAKTGVSSNW